VPINIGEWNEIANRYNELARIVNKKGCLEIIWDKSDDNNINCGERKLSLGGIQEQI
jgi:hypothetical protein